VTRKDSLNRYDKCPICRFLAIAMPTQNTATPPKQLGCVSCLLATFSFHDTYVCQDSLQNVKGLCNCLTWIIHAARTQTLIYSSLTRGRWTLGAQESHKPPLRICLSQHHAEVFGSFSGLPSAIPVLANVRAPAP